MMAELVNAKDWSKTPLGPIDKWPQSLRTMLSLYLTSNFPISIAWVRAALRHTMIDTGLLVPETSNLFGQDYKECQI